jgi:CheY-like chemotaxis protein
MPGNAGRRRPPRSDRDGCHDAGHGWTGSDAQDTPHAGVGRHPIPIIIATASASREDEAKSLEAGANAFIPKPIDHDNLLKIIGDLLSLTFIHDEIALENTEETGDFVVPPQGEIETLYQLARVGNMEMIRARADYLEQLDQRYVPFASLLRRLAEGYRSKAITTLVERYRSK